MYDDLRKAPNIETFELIQFVLPTVTGTCTLPGANIEGWYTPPTCQETVYGSQVYWFATQNAPFTAGRTGDLVAGEDIHRVIKSVKETPTQLKPGKGLSGRGSLAIVLKDFPGDPGPTRTTDEGTFLGKLKARNVMVNRPIQIMMGIVKDGIYNVADFQVRNYVIESMDYMGDNHWKLSCKDELYHLNKEEAVWPPQSDGFLRFSIGTATQTIPVDEFTDYSTAEVVIVNDELMRVLSVTNNLTPTAELQVDTRGSSINSLVVPSIRMSTNKAEDHDQEDAVFICYVADDMTLDELLIDMLTQTGLDISMIPVAEWAAEIAAWYPGFKLYTLWFESDQVNDQISTILEPFMLDLWFDVIERLARLSAISVWQTTTSVVREGIEIDSYSIKSSEENSLRFTRASIEYDKKSLTQTDDSVAYSKLSRFVDTHLEEPGLYGEVKLHQFDPSRLPDVTRADLLVQRFVQRFGELPLKLSWMTQERFLNFKVGDIVQVDSNHVQGFSGAPRDIRVQVLSITPDYKFSGRQYKVKSLAYANPEGSGGTPTFNLTGRQSNLNLYVLAGGPAEPVEVIFIFDNVTLGSTIFGQAAMVAGPFAMGSLIHIVCINGTKLRSRGGGGGQGGSTKVETEPGTPNIVIPGLAGKKGDDVYHAQGVDTTIYLQGAVDFGQIYNCDATLISPGGGGDGGNTNDLTNMGAGGGGGGVGQDGGPGAPGGTGSPFHPDAVGTDGTDGDEIGTPGIGGEGSNNGGTNGGGGGKWGVYGETRGTELDNDFAAPGETFVSGGAEITLVTDTVAELNARWIPGREGHEFPINLTPTPNLLINSEWQGGSSGVAPTNWTLSPITTLFFTPRLPGNANNVRSGSFSNGAGTFAGIGLSQTIALTPGTYQFIMYAESFDPVSAGSIANIKRELDVGPGAGTNIFYNGTPGRHTFELVVSTAENYVITLGAGVGDSTLHANVVLSRPMLVAGEYIPYWTVRGGK